MFTDNSVYRLISVQIPMFWDAIKFACVKSDEVDEKNYSVYFNELLHALLSDKAQCFIMLDAGKILHSVAISRITTDSVLGRKELLLQCVYSMHTMSTEELMRNLKVLVDLAKKEKCDAVTFNSRNPRVWEMAKLSDCKERTRNFVYELGGN